MSLNLSNSADTATRSVSAEAGRQELPGFVLQEKVNLEAKLHSGARWFFWIAALTMINSIIVVMNGNWSFLAGLGITQIIDGLALNISGQVGSAAIAIALILNATVAGVFVLFGLQAGKRQNWAFIIGMILYALDGLIFVLAEVWASAGFHVFALICIFLGLRASLKLNELEKANPGLSEAV
jgi:hypothetical protein